MQEFFIKVYNNEVVRFLFVGSLGAITNLALFFFTADLAGIPVNFCSLLAFWVGVTQNYFLNSLWSFKEANPMHVKGYIGYLGVNLVGLAANLIVLNLVIQVFAPNPKVVAQAVGIMIGTVFNYVLSSRLIFKA